jgi:hypothetical protein
VSDEVTTQTVGHEYKIHAARLQGVFHSHDPFLANRAIPVALLNTHERRVSPLPKSLPVLRPGITDPRKDENGRVHNLLLVAEVFASMS